MALTTAGLGKAAVRTGSGSIAARFPQIATSLEIPLSHGATQAARFHMQANGPLGRAMAWADQALQMLVTEASPIIFERSPIDLDQCRSIGKIESGLLSAFVGLQTIGCRRSGIRMSSPS